MVVTVAYFPPDQGWFILDSLKRVVLEGNGSDVVNELRLRFSYDADRHSQRSPSPCVAILAIISLLILGGFLLGDSGEED